MRYLAVGLALFLGFIAGIVIGNGSTPAPPAISIAPGVALPTEPTRVFFSPRGGCTQAIVDEISKAQESILIQAYGFTSEPIAGALLGALKRGVKVEALLDRKSNTTETSDAEMIARGGASVYLDGAHAIAHNKVMVIDAQTVITGSFNFTNAAEHSNAENLLIIHDAKLASVYAENWKVHLAHSVALGSVPVREDGAPMNRNRKR